MNCFGPPPWETAPLGISVPDWLGIALFAAVAVAIPVWAWVIRRRDDRR